jgi:peptidoglycan hydrolase CwlO-like protein
VLAALWGFAGVALAAVLTLLAALRTARPAEHIADIQGLSTLLDEMRKQREDDRATIARLQQDLNGTIPELRGEVRKLEQTVSELRADATGLQHTITELRDTIAGLREELAKKAHHDEQ